MILCGYCLEKVNEHHTKHLCESIGRLKEKINSTLICIQDKFDDEINKINKKIDGIKDQGVTKKYVDSINKESEHNIITAQFWFNQAEFFKAQARDLTEKLSNNIKLIDSLENELSELKKRHEWLVNQTPNNKRLNDQFNGGCCL